VMEKKTVLVVDDELDMRIFLSTLLETSGYRPVVTRDGHEGIIKARDLLPDLIILDVMMDSVLDGVSMSQQAHDDDTIRDIPILMVTSIANTDYAELFPTDEYIHIRAFMSKPLDPARLIKQVNKLLS